MTQEDCNAIFFIKMNVIHSPLEENTTNLQPSYRQHISRAVLEAVCFQVMASSKNIVREWALIVF